LYQSLHYLFQDLSVDIFVLMGQCWLYLRNSQFTKLKQKMDVKDVQYVTKYVKQMQLRKVS